MEWSTRAALSLGTIVASAPVQHHKYLEHRQLQQTCSAQQIMHTAPETKQAGGGEMSVEWSLEAVLCFGMYDIMLHLW